MGIYFKRKVPESMFNKRLKVELCENVHLHYRNLRLEFSKEEFLFLLKHLKSLDEKEIEDFEYKDNSKDLIHTNDLPTSTEFNDRLQIEEVGDHYHVHYRNLRIETTNLRELGYWEVPEPISMDYDYFMKILSKNTYDEVKVEDRRIGDLKVTIYDDPINHRSVPVSESPCLMFLNGDEEGYIEYIQFVKEFKIRKDGIEEDIHSVDRFKSLIASLEDTDYKDCLIVVFENLIGDGQHRAAWLYNKYGNDKVIKVVSVK